MRQRLFQLRKLCGGIDLVEGGATMALAVGLSHDLADSDRVLGDAAHEHSADFSAWLRVQRERMDEDLGDGPGEFLARYGLTSERFARAASGAVVMHPGPINRGVEIDGVLADDPARSLIVRQVEMGVAVRMACLDRLTASRRG